ncbi:HIT domain-containing protein [Actinocrinis puniceicyclus]|uniref:HIT domain-containing protein n=1 Tax=Actinocrinis puniceicyclus TaxID=977794 RepID=A0A8J7WRB7_9ACTN|nr:HIT domain-containing protein [Actinocrinis puniceicyclus]
MESGEQVGVQDGTGLPGGTGVPDDVERLWMPHRMAYIKGENKPANAEPGQDCPFCRVPTLSDAEGLIVARGELVYAVLNLYPYSPGHLLICPYRHVADYTELTAQETAELAEFTKQGMTALRSAYNPHGFNLGMNQGTVAGAGIAAHLHQHIVPRWGGDANFMPVIGRTRVLPQLLTDTRELVARHWSADAASDTPSAAAADASGTDARATAGDIDSAVQAGE